MSEAYTVLARRYRSRNFGELVGQEAIAQTLRNAITTGRLAHAFLFTGTRGVGKTSSARILAKAINCPNSKEGQPCGQCPTCLAISRGEDIDVIEIDGASNNGVDNIRDLRQSAGITPSHSPYKIYIIDEVHMLSSGAFNALLKTLEEPPPHVKFIFATTDVHKVPPTILSRCQRYDFKNIPAARIAEHLTAICQTENVAADAAALHRIAILAAGSMRDALSLLDRVLSLGAQRITEPLLDELLGKPSVAALASLAEALIDAQPGLALEKAQVMLDTGMAPEHVLAEMTDFFRNLMVLRVCGDNTPLLDVPAEWRSTLAALAPKLPTPVLVHHIALCDQTQRSIRNSTMPRPLFDALLVRLALAAEFSAIREVLEQASDAQKKNDTVISAAPVTPRLPASAPLPSSSGSAPLPGYVPIHSPPHASPPKVDTLALQTNLPPDGPTANSSTEDVAMAWQTTLDLLRASKFATMLAVLDHRSRLVSLDMLSGNARVEIDGHLRSMLSSPACVAAIESHLGQTVGRTVRLEIIWRQPAPAPAREAPKEALHNAAAPPQERTAPPSTATAPVSPETLAAANELPVVKRLAGKFKVQVLNARIVEPESAET